MLYTMYTMKLFTRIFTFIFLTIFLCTCSLNAQTFTMNKKCRELNSNASSLLTEKKYQEALDAFTTMQSSCSTKDAKEAYSVGKAQALNGLGKYSDALAASEEAIKVTKDKSLSGYFQKAVALNKMGQVQESNAAFQKVIALTEKNQDTKARASNYALLSLMHYYQLNQQDSGYYYLAKAMELDPNNANFFVQKGDMLVAEKKYDAAFEQYDKAVALGKNDMEMYQIRTEGHMKMVQEKYGTTNTQELRSKMTPAERDQLCTELQKAISLGLHDMKMDMFSSMVCK